MSWKSLIGQGAARDYLCAALRGGRAPHAYLFEGPEGVGKRTAAVLLAQALLCHEPANASEPCGACNSCRWIAARKGLVCGHPDLLVPIKFNLQGQETEKLVGDHEPLIPLPTMHDLGRKLHRAPRSGPRRVALIPEAHRMCGGQAEAANAFLKTLEEPPKSSIVILTSSRPEALLETIVSRCQPVRFRNLSLAEVRAGLEARGKCAEEDLALASALAGGSLGRAIDFLEGDLKGWWKEAQRVLDAFGPRSCPAFGLSLWALSVENGKRLFEKEREADREATEIAEDAEEADGEPDEAAVRTEAGWQRFVFRRMLELCELAFRDALLSAACGEGAPPLQTGAAGLARGLAARFGAEGCERVLEALREALRATRLNVRGDLIGRVLSGKMVEALARS